METPTIRDLYSEKATIEVKFKEKTLPFSVDMIDAISKYGENLRPDCKINHFGYNKWFRTNLGMSNKKGYTSIQSLKGAITRTAKRKGLTVEKYILKFNK